MADGGTIFLDEIGEMPILLQAKLLRVLQERQFERIGGTRTIEADVRVISATNVDLQDSVDRGLFRSDLYYRLHVVPLRLPPLRERREDIPLLIEHFLNSSNSRNDREVHLTETGLDYLQNYDWPGNVRELQNLIERLVILADRDVIDTLEISEHLDAIPRPPDSLGREGGTHPAIENAAAVVQGSHHASLMDLERQEIEAALLRNGWVQARAARDLGLTQRQIGYRIKKFNLQKPDFTAR